MTHPVSSPARTGETAAGGRTLVVACGALAHEIVALVRSNGWGDRVTVQCLPPELHNRPGAIAPAVRERLAAARGSYARAFVAYAECGTAGALDEVLDELGVERLPGAHCYELFAGGALMAQLSQAEPGTFFLTDFLARHFDRLILDGLGITAHPELERVYFGNYRRLVYLSQSDSPALQERARAAAARLGLAFEHRATGLERLGDVLVRVVDPPEPRAPWRPPALGQPAPRPARRPAQRRRRTGRRRALSV